MFAEKGEGHCNNCQPIRNSLQSCSITNNNNNNNKLNDLIGDIRKFKECAKDQSQIVKGKINEIIKEYKSTDPALHKMLVRSGDFYDGHLYGLPKILKNKEDPPLRPIVSMSGTVTHDLRTINNMNYLLSQLVPLFNFCSFV